MSNKNLLNESQVRQFMKLASLTPLTPGFVRGLTETTATETEDLEEVRTGTDPSPNLSSARRGHGRGTDGADRLEEEESHEEEELHATEDELGHEDHVADEEADELDAMSSEEPVDVDNAEQSLSVADVVSAITSALEDLTGQPVEASIDGADVDGAEDEVEADVELDAELDMGADDDVDVDVEDEMLAEEEGSKKGEYRRKDKDGKVGHRAGEGKDGHYKDYEGPEGGNKGDDSKTHPGKKDYEKNESTEATDELVEQITKRVAARILKAALNKK